MPKPVAPAVPAATILMVRDGRSGLEVFMVVRHHQIDFASGALVFPGGKVDEQDAEPALRARQTQLDQFDDMQNQLRAAALREAFEETELLLARPSASSPADWIDQARARRSAVHDGAITFAALLGDLDLQLDSGALVHYAHWITPEMMPKRFDTHFYLAPVPAQQTGVHDGKESVDSVWISPKQALAEAASKQRTVIFPTLRNLEKLAHYATVAEAITGTLRSSIVPVLPWTEERSDGRYLCIPREAGYDISEEKMQG